MTGEVRIVLTIAFAVTGAFCLWRCVDFWRSRRLSDRIGYGAHVLMAVSMVAMVWAPPPLVGWQMAIFALATGWFVVQAVGVSGLTLRSAAAPVQVAEHGHHDRPRCLHHAALMALMVWMFQAMSPSAMAGMNAGGRDGMTMSHGAGSTPVVAMTGGVYATVAAALLGIAALVALRRRGDGRSAREDAAHAVMTAGMAGMLFVMA